MSEAARAARPAPSQRKFVAMMATLFASVALSIDGTLPALPEMAAALGLTLWMRKLA